MFYCYSLPMTWKVFRASDMPQNLPVFSGHIKVIDFCVWGFSNVCRCIYPICHYAFSVSYYFPNLSSCERRTWSPAMGKVATRSQPAEKLCDSLPSPCVHVTYLVAQSGKAVKLSAWTYDCFFQMLKYRLLQRLIGEKKKRDPAFQSLSKNMTKFFTVLRFFSFLYCLRI